MLKPWEEDYSEISNKKPWEEDYGLAKEKPQGRPSMFEAAKGAGKQEYISSMLALKAPFGAKEAYETAEKEREAVTERPAFNYQAIKEAEGFVPTAKEVGAQLPGVAASQAPTLTGMYGGYKAGAALGKTFGPRGEVIGGTLGAGVVPFLSHAGENIEAQIKEQLAQGKEPDPSLLKAYATAAGQTALDIYGGVTGLLTKRMAAEGLAATGESAIKNFMAKKAAERGLVSSAAIGAGKVGAEEGVIEALQEAGQRAQAGQSLTDEAARKAYEEQFVGGAMAAPFGAASGIADRNAAIASVEQMDKERADEEARQQAEKESRFQNIAQNIKSSEGVNLQDLINRNIGIEAEMSEKEKKKQDSEYLKDINGWLNEDSGERTTNPDGTERL